MPPSRDSSPLVLSDDDRQKGEVGFAHKSQRKGARPKGKPVSPGPQNQGYTAMGMEARGEEHDPTMTLELVAAPGAEDDSENRGCICGAIQNGVGQLRDAVYKAIDAWYVFAEEVGQMRSTLWSAAGSVVQWTFPMLAAMFSIFVQAFAARLATLYYIRYMTRLDEIVDEHKGMPDPLGDEWLKEYHYDYPQKLQDIFASFVPAVSFPAYVWDLSLFPFTLLCLCLIIMKKDVYMWTKLCVCFTFLDLGRAACHVSTVVPDAQGWAACKARLTNFGSEPTALKEMAEMHIDWRSGPLSSLVSIVQAEVKGMRYCGDMIYSGQTFVMLLFTLGMLQVIRRHWKDHKCLFVLAALISLPCVLAGSIGTLLARYHYTIDVLLALLLTGLWFDSSTVDRFCSWWESLVTTKKKEKIFLPDRNQDSSVSAFSMAVGAFFFLLELATTISVARDFYLAGQTYIAMIYAGSMLMVSFMLVFFSIYMFEKDPDLSHLHVCVRLLLALILGSTHTVFLLTQGLSFKRKRIIDEVLVIKIFKAAVQSAPLACIQLRTLVTHEEADSLVWESDHFWTLKRMSLIKRYVQMFLAFISLAEAVALFDSMRSSVLETLLRNILWRSMLLVLRTSEVASRICVVVIAQVFLEKQGFMWGGLVMLGADFLMVCVLTRCLGVSKKFLAVCFSSLISMASNIYFFQKDEDRRRLADVLVVARTSELFIFCAAVVWYFKFYPGGMHFMVHFAVHHTGAVAMMVISLVTYFFNLAIWLGIREANTPQAWDDQENAHSLDLD